jgi:hypothetical protein
MTVLPKNSNQKLVPEIVNIDDSGDESNDHKYPALFGKQVKHKVVVYNLYIVFL